MGIIGNKLLNRNLNTFWMQIINRLIKSYLSHYSFLNLEIRFLKKIGFLKPRCQKPKYFYSLKFLQNSCYEGRDRSAPTKHHVFSDCRAFEANVFLQKTLASNPACSPWLNGIDAKLAKINCEIIIQFKILNLFC